MSTRKWQSRFDSSGQPIRSEKREHAARKQQAVGRSQNYRSRHEHPNFAEETAKAQEMLDTWAQSLNGDNKTPRSR